MSARVIQILVPSRIHESPWHKREARRVRVEAKSEERRAKREEERERDTGGDVHV